MQISDLAAESRQHPTPATQRLKEILRRLVAHQETRNPHVRSAPSNKAGRVWGAGMSPKVLWDVVRVAAGRAGIEKLAPARPPSHVCAALSLDWWRLQTATAMRG